VAFVCTSEWLKHRCLHKSSSAPWDFSCEWEKSCSHHSRLDHCHGEVLFSVELTW